MKMKKKHNNLKTQIKNSNKNEKKNLTNLKMISKKKKLK